MNARNHGEAAAVILLYHRVAEVDTDPQLLCVTPRHFNEQLEVLRQLCHPLSLGALVDALREGEVPDRAVAITFDDGYADNLTAARPVLERLNLTATVFVVAGEDGGAREFWWDELERLLLRPGTLPRTLRLDLDGGTFAWDLGERASCGDEEYARDRGWNVLCHPCVTGGDRRSRGRVSGPRQELYRALHQRLRPLDSARRGEVLAALLEWSGIRPGVRPSHRPLSAAEVRLLAEGEVVEIGAHTVTHPVLSALPTAAQLGEITESKRRLEKILGCPLRGFSYPYGGRADYLAETVSLVRQAGFRYACSNISGPVVRATDPYQLPRVLVRDWDADEFARRVDQVLGGG